jgi:hypothetical protein
MRARQLRLKRTPPGSTDRIKSQDRLDPTPLPKRDPTVEAPGYAQDARFPLINVG